MEVAAAAGDGGDDDDDDNDDDYDDDVESAPVAESVEVAVAAGDGGEDDDDDDNDDYDDDVESAPVAESVGHSGGDASSHADRKRKPSGGGIILGQKLESRSDHRGMGSVTTTIKDCKRKSAGGPI